MRAIILTTNEDVFKSINLLLGQNGVVCEQAISLEELDNKISLYQEDNPPDIFAIDFDSKIETGDFHKTILAKVVSPYLIYMGHSSVILNKKNEFKFGPQYMSVVLEQCLGEPAKKVQDQFKHMLERKITIDEKKGAYTMINLTMIHKQKVIPCDLFLNLGTKDHKVCVFKKGTEIEKEDIEKYEKRGVTHFLLTNADYVKFVKTILENMAKDYKIKKEPPTRLISLSRIGQDAFHQCISAIGISDETLEIADQTVTAMNMAIKKCPNLITHLKSLQKGLDYFSEHPLITLIIALEVAKKLEWESELTATKLSYTCFFHDIALKDKSLADVRPDTDRWKELSDSQIQDIESHTRKAADFLSEFNNLPPDVYRIVEQHHEQPDGKGFPKGLNAGKVDPLSCLFIICEEFVHATYQTSFHPMSLAMVMDEIMKKYTQNHYGEVAQALKDVISKTIKQKKSA